MVIHDPITLKAINGLYEKFPHLSASFLSYKSFCKKLFCFFLLTVLLSILFNTTIAVSFIITFVNLIYFVLFISKAFIFFLGYFQRILIGNEIEKKEIQVYSTGKNENLPIYTILIPLYKERNTIENLLRSIYNLDYPQAKLDVKLILEEDDIETIDYVSSIQDSYNFETVITPNSLPKTKPKACNYALQFARGEYVTIYDAEDIPNKLQLRNVLFYFNNASDDTICIQAQLNYYNRDENILTKMFALEYSMWFDFMIKGLSYLALPIPLGGTSNHFKTKKLLEIGSWDACNVTEDADVGIRIARFGCKCLTISDETLEECPSTFIAWLKQRSRWIKGYIQTYFVHMRNPKLLFKELGLKEFVAFQIFIGGTFFTFVTLIPLLFTSLILWNDIIKLPNWVSHITSINLYCSMSFLILSSFLTIKFRCWNSMCLSIILFPFYWILHCLASFKAIYQIMSNRSSFWEKTEHGKSIVFRILKKY